MRDFSKYSLHIWVAVAFFLCLLLLLKLDEDSRLRWRGLAGFAISQTAQVGVPMPTESTAATTTDESSLFTYIEAINGCGPYYEGTCVNVRSGPGAEYSVVGRLRNGQVLKIQGKEIRDGHVWYQILFDGALRYPERITNDWFVSAEYAREFLDIGDRDLQENFTASTTKRIVVDISDQMLYAYDADALFMKEPISTGLELTPTPRGTFTVYKMTPSRYMQGPIPEISDQYYDLPGVPWNLYFTYEGAVVHGAYWHDHFGEPWSHGCVNLPPNKAKELYMWADIGARVTVRD